MRVTRALVLSYMDRFNAHVSPDKRVKLKQWSGYYIILTANNKEVYTGLTIREAYTCIRGMLYAIGQL